MKSFLFSSFSAAAAAAAAPPPLLLLELPLLVDVFASYENLGQTGVQTGHHPSCSSLCENRPVPSRPEKPEQELLRRNVNSKRASRRRCSVQSVDLVKISFRFIRHYSTRLVRLPNENNCNIHSRRDAAGGNGRMKTMRSVLCSPREFPVETPKAKNWRRFMLIHTTNIWFGKSERFPLPRKKCACGQTFLVGQ